MSRQGASLRVHTLNDFSLLQCTNDQNVQCLGPYGRDIYLKELVFMWGVHFQASVDGGTINVVHKQ